MIDIDGMQVLTSTSKERFRIKLHSVVIIDLLVIFRSTSLILHIDLASREGLPQPCPPNDHHASHLATRLSGNDATPSRTTWHNIQQPTKIDRGVASRLGQRLWLHIVAQFL